METGKRKNRFSRQNTEAKSVIIQCVTEEHPDIIKDVKNTKQMMKSLEDSFERKSIFTKLTLKCAKTDKVKDHLLRFDTLVRELEGVSSKVDKSDKTSHLLFKLNENYIAVPGDIGPINNDLTIDFIKSLDEELKLKYK